MISAGVKRSHLYEDQASGKKDDRPGLEACLKGLREGDTLIVWKLDRLGRNLRHLVNTIHDLMERGICFRVLTGQGANIDTTTASGRLVFGIFAALAEFERELIRERTIAGLSSARARGRNGGLHDGARSMAQGEQNMFTSVNNPVPAGFDALPVLDLRDLNFTVEGNRILAELRAKGPICRVEPLGALGFLRWADCDAILRDFRTFSAAFEHSQPVPGAE